MACRHLPYVAAKLCCLSQLTNDFNKKLTGHNSGPLPGEHELYALYNVERLINKFTDKGIFYFTAF